MNKRIAMLLKRVAMVVAGGLVLAFTHGKPLPPVTGVQPLQFAQKWGGGLNAHQHWATPAHLLMPDGHGVYLQSTVDSSWFQIFSDLGLKYTACSPPYTTVNTCFGMGATTGTGQTVYNTSVGAIDGCVSADTSGLAAGTYRAWVYFGDGFLYRTDASGSFGGGGTSEANPANPSATTLINTRQLAGGTGGLAQTNDNSNLDNRVDGPFILCDPAQKNHVMLGTQGFTATDCAGNAQTAIELVCESLDGGATVATVSPSDIPTAVVSNTQRASGYIFAIDGGSGTTTRGGVTVTNTICAFAGSDGVIQGNNVGGFYCSVNGGRTGTWGRIGTSQIAAANTQIVWAANVATVTTNSPHNIPVGTKVDVLISGALPSGYNGTFVATVNGANSFTYALLTDPGGTDTTSNWTLSFEAANVVFDPTNHILFQREQSGCPGNTCKVWSCVVTSLMSCVTWTLTLPASDAITWIASDPLTPSRMAATGSGLYTCTSSCMTTTSWTVHTKLGLLPGDTPWYWSKVATSSYNINPSVYNIQFDPVHAGVIGANFGQQYWTTTFPTSSAQLNYTINSKGIQHGADDSVAAWSAYGKAIFGGQDNDTCAVNIVLLPPQSCPPTFGGLKWASAVYTEAEGTYAVSKVSPDMNGGSDMSGFSGDGFQSDFHLWNDWERTVPGTALCGSTGGCGTHGSGNVVVTVDDTSALTTWTNGQGDFVCSIPTQVTVTPSNGNNLYHGSQPYTDCYPVSKLSGTQFALVGTTFSYDNLIGSYGGGYQLLRATPPRSTFNSGRNIVSMSNNAGLIHICVFNNTGTQIGNNYRVDITTAVDDIRGAASVANGKWRVANNNIATRCFDLASSDATNLGNLVSGGVVGSNIAPGGHIAASGNDILVAPAADIPQCSTDKGKTWKAISNAAIPAVITTVTAGGGAGATSMTVADATNIVLNNAVYNVTMDDGRYMYVTFASKVGNVLTFTAPYSVPIGHTLLGGNVIPIVWGWDASESTNNHSTVAEPGGRFYSVNSIYGLVTWNDDCTATTISNSLGSTNDTSHWQRYGGAAAGLAIVPGEIGNLLYTDGYRIGAINGTGLQRSCNGVNTNADDGSHTNGITFGTTDGANARVPGTFAPMYIAVGKAKPGKSYPAIYYGGWYDPTGADTEANGVWGYWQSTDDPNHGNTGSSAVCKTNGAQFTGSISNTTLTVSAVAGGTILAGDGLLAPTASGGRADLSVGTQIVVQLTGSTGGVGTYQINISQTRASESMTSGGTFQQIADWPVTFVGGGKTGIAPSGLAADQTTYGAVYVQTNAGPAFMVAP